MHAREPLLLRKLAREGLVRIRVFARQPLDRAPAREPPQLPAIARRLHERPAHDPVQRHLEERLDLLEAVVRAEDARVDAVADVDVEEFAGEAEGLALPAESAAQCLGRGIKAAQIRALRRRAELADLELLREELPREAHIALAL